MLYLEEALPYLSDFDLQQLQNNNLRLTESLVYNVIGDPDYDYNSTISLIGDEILYREYLYIKSLNKNTRQNSNNLTISYSLWIFLFYYEINLRGL